MKAVIFDFDGTLADSLLLGLGGVNRLAKRFRYEEFHDTDYLRAKGVKQIIKEDLGLRWYQFPFYLLALKKELQEDGLIGKRWEEHREGVLELDEADGLSERIIRSIFNGDDSDESDTEFPKAPPKKPGLFYCSIFII